MTLNNLSEHLSWLLRDKPCLPVVRPPRPAANSDQNGPAEVPASDDQPTRSASLAAVSRLETPPVTNRQPLSASLDVHDANIPLQLSQRTSISTTAADPVAPPQMARLQATSVPRSVPVLKSTSTTAGRPQHERSGHRDSARKPTLPMDGRLSEPSRSCPQVERSRTVEILDLTKDVEELEDAALEEPTGSNTKASKKRKSSELEHDNDPETSAQKLQRSRKPTAIANSSDSEDATAILEHDPLPLDPPPPYSTLVPEPVTNVRKSDHRRTPQEQVFEHFSAHDMMAVRSSSNPVAADPNPTSPVVISQTHSSAAFTPDDLDLLDSFSKWSLSTLQTHIDRAQQTLETACLAYVAALDNSDEDAEPGLFEESTKAKSVHRALESLRDHRDHMQVLDIQKQNHLQMIRKAVMAGVTRPPDTEELKRIKSDLQQAKIASLPLLRSVAVLLRAKEPLPCSGPLKRPEPDAGPVIPKCAASASAASISAPSMAKPPSSVPYREQTRFKHCEPQGPAVPVQQPERLADKENKLPSRSEIANFDDDGDPFETVMGTPPAIAFDSDEAFDEFGSDDDDHLLELADNVGAPKTTIETAFNLSGGRKATRTNVSGGTRAVFSETSGNGFPVSQAVDKQSIDHIFGYRWSNDVKRALRDTFNLKGFRSNQLDAINATLAGKDVFVLMPTGGGKSLCYQLPSIIRSGETGGVTVVISPLISLMEDQVDHLTKLGIQAAVLNSNSSKEDKAEIFDALYSYTPEDSIQLLYITPEMLTKNQRIITTFQKLQDRGKFARIVIDEAHCVSQWGHDFRPDYTQIGEIKAQFKGVPLMALTATATEHVKHDVMNNLGIRGCEVFTQSFNRPNLYYEVRIKRKGPQLLDAIAEIIRQRDHAGKSGIIYCLSRKTCEDVAKALKSDYNIRAKHYHAKLSSEEKSKVQRDWQKGTFQVIVATIAFGMGIDKGNVRYVIHHSIPKSLEGYYQETGRAGRDSKRSGCYLFYSYADTALLNKMIDGGEGSYDQKERQRSMLRKMVAYCEDRAECRRVQVLDYFSEKFPKELCKGQCDNCNSKDVVETLDFTDAALSAVRLVRKVSTQRKQNVTLIRYVDILRGIKSKANAGFQELDEFGSVAQHTRNALERLMYHLLMMEVLYEDRVDNKAGFSTNYIRTGRKANAVLDGGQRVTLSVRLSTGGDVIDDNAESDDDGGPLKGKKKATKRQAKPKTKRKAAALPLSTNVSSPPKSRRNVQDSPSSRRQKHQDLGNFVIADDDASDSDDDGFAPVRGAGNRRRREQRRDLGPPITTDERMMSLTSIHRDVVDNFVEEAKRECQRIKISKSMKTDPFTEANLREMAILFPTSLGEMSKLPNFDLDKVQTFGRHFLTILRKYHENFKEMMQDTEEVVRDPNHENVINLCTDEDEGDNDDEDDYGSSIDGDLQDLMDDERNVDRTGAESSSYFDAGSVRFATSNSRSAGTRKEKYAQAAKGRSSTWGTGDSRQSSRQSRKDSGGSRGERNKTARKPSAGTSNRTAGRVTKPARQTAGRRSNDAANSNRISSFLYNGQGDGRPARTTEKRQGGIGMMPT